MLKNNKCIFYLNVHLFICTFVVLYILMLKSVRFTVTQSIFVFSLILKLFHLNINISFISKLLFVDMFMLHF